MRSLGGQVGAGLGGLLLVVLGLPILALAISAVPGDLWHGVQDPLFAPALGLSLRTTALSLVLIVLMGTPLAYWLASRRHLGVQLVEVLIDLPIVMPPAVLGVSLLQAYGRRGLLGDALALFDIALPFSTAAVVMAQVVVAAPFYVQAAANAFRKVDGDLLLVAQTLGASSTEAFLRVAVPVALPGLAGGAALAWARSLGEFGATLLFAGNLPGRTQTLPVAIYAALESDVQVALAISLVLGGIAIGLLFALRVAPRLWRLRAVEVRG